MEIRPLAGHVFIEHVEVVQQRSGIILPDVISKEERNGGKIVAVAAYYRAHRGEERPMSCEVGQYAVFKPRTASVFSIQGRTFYAVHQDEILATMDEATFHQLNPITV
jgi:co-chaperonin GroES (HSP10)